MNYDTDFQKINQLAELEMVPEGYLWHQHQDGFTMQLVPKDLHEAFRYAGLTTNIKNKVIIE